MTACAQSQTEYTGNGSQVLYTFTFPYITQNDISVDIRNDVTELWQPAVAPYTWSFANATTIEFATAPITPTKPNLSNIRIRRSTDVNPLIAQFNPGSAIRARDLNDNFEQLQQAIEENQCGVDVNVDNIDGVTVVDPQSGQILEYDQGVWVNKDWHQSNWLTTDPSDPSYILNVPDSFGITYIGNRNCVDLGPVGNEVAGNFYLNTQAGIANDGWGLAADTTIRFNERLIKQADSSWTTFGGEYVLKTGDNMTGDLTLGTDPSSPAIELNADGSATFDGNVGIGTDDPQAKLHVKSDSVGIPGPGVAGSMQVGDGNGFGLMLGCNGSGVGYIQPQRNNGTTTTFDLLLSPNGGNVGIGTDNPSSLLHLAANVPYITFEDKDNNQDWQIRATSWFALRNQNNNSELLRVNPTGDVGIGTTNPQATLDVNGKARSTSTVVGDVGTTLATKDYVDANGGGGGSGVSSIIAGAGIAVDQATGDVTITNTGGGGGGGGGGTTSADIYGTAKAWGSVDANGALLQGRNCTVSAGNPGYNITFTVPMANADYSVVATSDYQPNLVVTDCVVSNKTANGFSVFLNRSDTGQSQTNAFNFAVFDEEPAEIIVGSGTVANTNLYGTAKAWGNIEADGTLGTNYKVVSSTRTAKGVYTVIWDNPSSSDYVVNLSPLSVSANTGITIISPTEFQIISRSTTTPDNGADSPTTFAIFDNEPAEVALTTFGDVINYNGASAWGKVDNTGTLISGLNIDSVTNTGTGKYAVTFVTPMPNADYSVGATTSSNGSVNVGVDSQTAAGFTYSTRRSDDNSGAFIDFGVYLQVFATNALPPKGGTGTDSWGSVQSDGTLDASFNVASVTRTGTGTYDVVFTTPMPSSNYVVTTAVYGGNSFGAAIFSAKSTTGFTIKTGYITNTNIPLDYSFDFTVNATNATLPQTVTQEQIESAINNPGASAWANTSLNGSNTGLTVTVDAGLNIASIARDGTGKYTATFTTAMPSADYSVVGSVCDSGGNSPFRNFQVTSQSATQFSFSTGYVNYDTGGMFYSDSGFNFTVFATNALPPEGGTGADAWCTSSGDGFNIASVTQSSGNGNNWSVVFTTPMPSDDYAVVATPVTSSAGTCFIRDRTSTGFSVVTRDYDGSALALGWTAVVHATNATLPLSFTSEQIDAAINNPGCSAWGDVAINGTLNNGLNVATYATGVTYVVTFPTPMPDANYAITFGSDLYPYIVGGSKTANGFQYKISDGNTGDLTAAASFAVFATNALPPKGGTGTDAWGSAQSDGTLDASFNVASVTRAGTGLYDVVFTTPMPISSYAISVSSGANQPRFLSRTATGFRIETRNASGTVVDANTAFQVNATNATLPATFTYTQVQTFLDLGDTITTMTNRVSAIESGNIIDDATDSALIQLIASLAARVTALENA